MNRLLAIARELRILSALTGKMSHQSWEQNWDGCGVGLNMLQYGLMRTIQAHPYTISELSRKFFLDPSTLVPVVDSLENKGFVQRGRDPNDRRRAPLALTPQGTELLSREMPVKEDDPFVRAVASLGEERAEQLRVLLRDLLRQMPDGDEILHGIETRLHSTPAPPPTEEIV